ncbi:hypothetical protein HNR03_003988 [Pseudomonas sp. JAI111]|uniref:hypothetical protein n=1 Tax=Pseudomonas sp. JAI111 TaxID=2735913 RepID=UPI002167D69C|nr:hypothetical protein [Pseudomonas sp. JAI111]MCS3839377.1 hypothetical protein [Pseudomonas sp. JAI111]
MTKQLIGPSFIEELTAHGGLVGQHFTWSPDGTIEFFSDTLASVISGVEAVYAAHDPAKPSWSDLKLQAQAALDGSDVTITRCAENAVSVPSDWVSYRKALRAIVGAESGDATQELPIKPAYPAGT